MSKRLCVTPRFTRNRWGIVFGNAERAERDRRRRAQLDMDADGNEPVVPGDDGVVVQEENADGGLPVNNDNAGPADGGLPAENLPFNDAEVRDALEREDGHVPSPDPSEQDANPRVSKDSWTVREVGLLLMLVQNRNGIAVATMDCILGIIGIMINGKRAASDLGSEFPDTVFKMKSTLKLDAYLDRTLVKVPFCSRVVPRALKMDPMKNPPDTTCGRLLDKVHDVSGKVTQYTCDTCGIGYSPEQVLKEGNFFATRSLRDRAEVILGREGKHVPLLRRDEVEPATILKEVTQGQRIVNMDLEEDAVVFLIHFDGADSTSKSSSRKAYFSFGQVANVPAKRRRNRWFVQMVWAGDAKKFPKDREPVLAITRNNLEEMQRGKPSFRPIRWTCSSGREVESEGYLGAVIADAPEQAETAGRLSHGAKQGCPYCCQCAKWHGSGHYYEFRLDETPDPKTHTEFMVQIRKLEAMSSNDERHDAVYVSRVTDGVRRRTGASLWRKFDLVNGFALDIMHMLDKTVTTVFLQHLHDEYFQSKLAYKRDIFKQLNQRWLKIVVAGHENRRTRSLALYKRFKAHENRFFMLAAAAFIGKGILDDDIYEIMILASWITWAAHRPTVAVADLPNVQSICDAFLQKFQNRFGFEAMKFYVHMIRHLPLAMKLFGPLSGVCCYSPEDHIGKMVRKLRSSTNTTVHLMNVALTQEWCMEMVGSEILGDHSASSGIKSIAERVLGQSFSACSVGPDNSVCQLKLKSRGTLEDELWDSVTELLERAGVGADLGPDRMSCVLFKSAVVESGIQVKIWQSYKAQRNFDFVTCCDGTLVRVKRLIGYNEKSPDRFERSIYVGTPYNRVERQTDFVGTDGITTTHVVAVAAGPGICAGFTANIFAQVSVLDPDPVNPVIALPPNQFRPT